MPLRLIIWHSLSKQIAAPSGVDRTITPSHSIRLLTPVSSLILSLDTVKSILNLVPVGNGSGVYINAPDEDMSLVLSSNTCFLPDVIVSILAENVRGNLSYCRRSITGKAFHSITKARKQKNTKKIIKFCYFVIFMQSSD